MTARTPATDLESLLLSSSALDDIAVAEARARDEARRLGLPLGPELTGFSPTAAKFFDTGCLPNEGIGLITGRSGSGKSGLGMKLASTSGVPTVIVQADMNPVRCKTLLAVEYSGEPIKKFMDGTLSADEIEQLMREATAKLPLLAFIDAGSKVSSVELACAARAWREHHHAEHALVVLDSLQSWSQRSLGHIKEEYQRSNTAIDELFVASRDSGAFFLLVSERSNAGADDAAAAHGKGTGHGGYAGEVTLALDTAGPYDPVSGLTPLNLYLAKNRAGTQCVTVPLWFEGRVQRFFDAAGPHIPQRNGNGKPRPPHRLDAEPEDE